MSLTTVTAEPAPPPIKRGRGRPRTGRDPSLSLRLPQLIIGELEQLAEARGVPRSQIARELIIIALLGAQQRG
jgi:hypothetical protein